MKPPPFRYHAPRRLDELLQTIAAVGDGGKILAGGQSLVPMLNLRLARFDDLVDLGRVDELCGVQRHPDRLTVGAGTRDAAIETDPRVADAVPLLTLVTPYIGHFQIRNRGTVGGSIAHADPSAEYPAVARVLDATMTVASASGRRTIAAADFFTGFWSTSMEADEVLVSVDFPVWSGRSGFGVAEFARRHGDFAIAGAVAAVELDADAAIVRCALGLFGVSDIPVRLDAVERTLIGRSAASVDATALGDDALASVEDVTDDSQVPASYRARVAAAMMADAWTMALRNAEEER
ncbi:FAD binding domain-containing protein [Desertimonas flava]|uniref:FAD binding domain-containing protein n=1 Tax=Desertimonas flava TaxID=2064846 RepID=UPI000E34A56C|nr:FAD binding domain-containing protein [Desertimonas flava]